MNDSVDLSEDEIFILKACKDKTIRYLPVYNMIFEGGVARMNPILEGLGAGRVRRQVARLREKKLVETTQGDPTLVGCVSASRKGLEWLEAHGLL